METNCHLAYKCQHILIFCCFTFVFLFLPDSPLIVVLRALVHLDCVDSNKIDASNTVSFLLGIFRAIKKAEDAVDVKLTPVCIATLS